VPIYKLHSFSIIDKSITINQFYYFTRHHINITRPFTFTKMPPTTRRSTGSVRGRSAPARGQSTLSFSNRVTKSVPKSAKKGVISASVAKVKLPEETQQPKTEEVEEIVIDEPEVEEPVEDESEPEVEAVPEKSDSELRAERISDGQISRYWKGLEAQRKAPRVHMEDLTLSEKVLRYFDVSSQYGVSKSLTKLSFVSVTDFNSPALECLA
jgi:DNA polymerase delta subunit 4